MYISDSFMATIPKKSSSVIVLREADKDGFEVLLLKRSENSVFMGGNFVYPGGIVDKNDSTDNNNFNPFYVACIRELFEEAGILIARNRVNKPVSFSDGSLRTRFEIYRKRLQNGDITLQEIMQNEGLSLALDRLSHYAHWITPEARPLRFDTHFFITIMPEGQQASPDKNEITECIWTTPLKGLEENIAGRMVLSPPTHKILEDLLRFRTIEEIIGSLQDKDIKPVLPKLVFHDKGSFVVFPCDPEYDLFKNGSADIELDHGKPSTPFDNTTRVLFQGSRGIPYCKKI